MFGEPLFLIPAGVVAGAFFGVFGSIKFLKNGNVKSKDCSSYRMEFKDELTAIGKSISSIEGYLEGIHGKKIKK